MLQKYGDKKLTLCSLKKIYFFILFKMEFVKIGDSTFLTMWMYDCFPFEYHGFGWGKGPAIDVALLLKCIFNIYCSYI